MPLRLSQFNDLPLTLSHLQCTDDFVIQYALGFSYFLKFFNQITHFTQYLHPKIHGLSRYIIVSFVLLDKDTKIGENILYAPAFLSVQRFTTDIVSFYNIPTTLLIVIQYAHRLSCFSKLSKTPLETVWFSNLGINLEQYRKEHHCTSKFGNHEGAIQCINVDQDLWFMHYNGSVIVYFAHI